MVPQRATDLSRRHVNLSARPGSFVHRPNLAAGVVVGAALVATGCVMLLPRLVSVAVFLPLAVLAGCVLVGRTLLYTLAVVVTCYAVAALVQWSNSEVDFTVFFVMVAFFVLLLLVARRQSVLVSLTAGPALLGDLRARLDRQAQVPDLGEEFRVETCVMPSSGQTFSGDFSTVIRRGDVCEVALTDVSGHGPSAGMRALLLSGALAGLLGEVPVSAFLPAANRYLIRQGWRDGFASCIHAALDLRDGRFEIGVAGHPSAMHFHADSGEWEVVSGAAGLLLGLFDLGPDDYLRAHGTLASGDFLLFYTDGVVEGSMGDAQAGTARMLRHAEEALSEGIDGAARRICVASTVDGGQDDRSVVVMWRSPYPMPR